jgi:hypothetical protein
VACAHRERGSAAAAAAAAVGHVGGSSASKRSSSVLQAQLLGAAKQRQAGCTLHTAVGCA